MATATITADDRISVAELARRLGVSTSTAYNHLRDGLIPGARQIAQGKGWRIPADAGM